MICTSKRHRRGFTLTEMLIVTVILGILMSIVIVAVAPALMKGKRTVIYQEMNQIEGHFIVLKNKFPRGGYPPTDIRMAAADDANAAIVKYMSRRFPFYNVANLHADLNLEGIDLTAIGFDPGFSLVFWLVGFSPDADNPFKDHAKRMTGEIRDSWLYDFDPERLIDGHYLSGDNNLYIDANRNGKWDTGEVYKHDLAFLYFDFKSYGIEFDYDNNTGTTNFIAYRTGNNVPPGSTIDRYYQETSFQIIHPGLDDKLGIGGSPPGTAALPMSYRGDDADNLTNFAGGQTMADFSDR